MLSRLRNSFRRKSSSRRHGRRRDGEEGEGESEEGAVGDLSRSRSISLASSCRSSTTGRSTDSLSSRRLPRSPNLDTQWQRSTPSVVDSNRVMFNRQINCDVMLVVGEDQALVGAHSFVLMSRSDVFLRMLRGPLAETGPIAIPDASEEVFRQFLRFLYVDQVALTPSNVTCLHYLGRKYDVEPLVQQCLEFLHASLTCDNALAILEQAHSFDEHELFKTSFEFVKDNIQACLSGSAVQDLCRTCLERLLSLDELEISEQPLFKAALAWAEASLEKKEMEISSEKVRQELGHALHLIRFPAMTFDFFKERVIPTGVLIPEEVKAIEEYKKRNRPSAEPFVGNGRKRVVHRFQNVCRVRCSNKTDSARWTAAITFSSDRDCYLHGINVFSCTRETQQARVLFSILKGQDQIDLFNRISNYDHTYNLCGDVDGIKTLHITIGNRLEIEANVEYTLVLQANMASCFSGTDGLTCVKLDDVTFRFRDAPIKMNGTTVSEGQLPSFVFSVR